MLSATELNLQTDETETRGIAELGLALIDRAFHPIAMDEGAASILSAIPSECRSGDAAFVPQKLPPVLLDHVRLMGVKEAASKEVHFIAANHCYSARASVMQSGKPPAAGPWILLRFERDLEGSEALAELSTTCGLTEREKEALGAIAIGLTSKEVAHRMNISPSTVKAFLRLIKIKTGARNRADLVAKLLDPRHRSGQRKEEAAPPLRAMAAGASTFDY